MRIAYVLDEPLPSTETSGEQAMNTIAGMCRAGAEVTLVLPRSAVRPPATRAEVCDYYGIEPAFELAHLRSVFPSHRALEKPAHAARALLDQHVRGHDVMYTRNIPALLGGLALGHRVAYEHYRPWPTHYPALAPVFRTAMRHRNFVGAVMHSEYARDSYLAIGVDPARIEVLHNGFEPARLEPRLSREAARLELGLPVDRPTAVYSGRVTLAKGLGPVLDMARAAPNVSFLLVGSEGEGEVERRSLDYANVRVFPWQPFDALSTFLYAADVLLIPPTLAPMGSNTVLPMKLFLYLAAGRAILGPESPDTAELLVHDRNAWLVPPDNVAAAVGALQKLLSERLLTTRLGNAAEVDAQSYTWAARGVRVVEFVSARL